MADPSKEPPTSSAADLASEIQHVHGRLKRALRTQASVGDLTQSQISVLVRLHQESPATVTTLAKEMGVRPQSMGATVSALQAAGLLSAAPDPKDGRQTLLSLSPACIDMIRDGQAIRHSWLLQRIQERLSPQEQAELAVALSLLGRLLDP